MSRATSASASPASRWVGFGTLTMAPGPTAPRPRHVWTRSSRRYNPLPKLPATIAISCSCCEVLQVSPVTHSTMLVLVVVLLLCCSTTTTTALLLLPLRRTSRSTRRLLDTLPAETSSSTTRSPSTRSPSPGHNPNPNPNPNPYPNPNPNPYPNPNQARDGARPELVQGELPAGRRAT